MTESVFRSCLVFDLNGFYGDGSGPIIETRGLLHAKGSGVVLSLGLFNRRPWELSAQQVVQVGLAKMPTCGEAAVGGAG